MARRFLPLMCVGAACVIFTGCSLTGNRGPSRWNWFGHAKQDAERLVSVARLSERHDKPEEARAGYHRALEIDPKNQTALHRLGVMATRDGQLDEAQKNFEQALASGKPNPDLLSDLGYAFYLKHDLARADAKLREALKLAPEHRAARNNLGLVLGEQRRFDEALAEFLKGGSEAEAYANLAYVQSQAGLLGDAEKNYHKALERDPNLRQATEAILQLADAKAKATGEPGVPPAPASRPQYATNPGNLPSSQFQSTSPASSNYGATVQAGYTSPVGSAANGARGGVAAQYNSMSNQPSSAGSGLNRASASGAGATRSGLYPMGPGGAGQGAASQSGAGQGEGSSGAAANVGDLPRPGAASGAFSPPTPPGATSGYGGILGGTAPASTSMSTAPTFSMPQGVSLR